MLDQIEYISVSASRLLWVPLLQRLTFEKRKSKQNALAPPLGTSPAFGQRGLTGRLRSKARS
ncbi:hypothetical protein, partial [Pseudomonas orientalis]|uniref:hypothetical protein n=1 Tax=Pseudomonas orientalis TaxID=76758 RepID=UPI001C629905